MSDFEENKKAYYHLRALQGAFGTYSPEESAMREKLLSLATQARDSYFKESGVIHHTPLTRADLHALMADIPPENQRAPLAKGVLAGQYAVADSASGLTAFLGTDYLIDCTGLALIGRAPDNPAHTRVVVGHFLYANDVRDSIAAMAGEFPKDYRIEAYVFNSADPYKDIRSNDNPYGQMEIVQALQEHGIRSITADVDGPSTFAVHVPTGKVVTSNVQENLRTDYDTRNSIRGTSLDLLFPKKEAWPKTQLREAQKAYAEGGSVPRVRLSKIYDDRDYMTEAAQKVEEDLGIHAASLQQALYPYPSDAETRAPLQPDKSDTVGKLARILPNMDTLSWQSCSDVQKQHFIRQVQLLPEEYLRALSPEDIGRMQKNDNALALPPAMWEAVQAGNDSRTLPVVPFSICADIGMDDVRCPVTPLRPKTLTGRPHS